VAPQFEMAQVAKGPALAQRHVMSVLAQPIWEAQVRRQASSVAGISVGMVWDATKPTSGAKRAT